MNKNDVNELPIISKQEQNFALWFLVKPVYYWQLFMHVTFFIAIFCLQGGFKAVIWADVFQSIIIVIGIFAILIQVSPRRDSVLLYILCSANKLKQ